MAPQDNPNDISHEFDALNVEENETLAEAWTTNTETPAASSALQPRLIGRIPNFFDDQNQNSRPRFALLKRTATRQVLMMVGVFGLGCMTYPIWSGIAHKNTLPTNTDQLAQTEIEQEGNDSSLKNIESLKDGELVSVRFNDLSTDEFNDDLYGTNIPNSTPSTIYTSNVENPYDSFSASTSNVEEDAFPTWADLAPQSEEEEEPTYASPSDEYASQYVPQQSVDVSQNVYEPHDESLEPTNAYPTSNESIITQSEPSIPITTAAQGFQGFQSFNTSNANNNNYNDNTNDENVALVNPSSNFAKKVDYAGTFGYNDYQKNNGYSTNSEVQEHASLPKPSVVPMYTDQAELARSSYNEVDSDDIYTSETETPPTYASSIPTFSNPHPERNADTRRAYVAQNYDSESSQPSSKRVDKASKPTRSVRW